MYPHLRSTIGVLPSQVRTGGTLSQVQGGGVPPSQLRKGTPSQVRRGVPHQKAGEMPHVIRIGVPPCQVQDRGYSISGQDKGYPILLTGSTPPQFRMEYSISRLGVTPLSTGWGIPHVRSRIRVPPFQVRTRGTPISGQDKGVPHPADGGTPSQVRMGVPPIGRLG